MHTMLESLMILIFEMFGTGLLAMLFVSTGGGISMFVGFFILLILSARISGSHYNPVITFAFMLRKDAGQFNKWLGILYMLFQCGGALIGTCFIYYCFRKKNEYLTLKKYYGSGIKWIQFIVSETFGSFMLTLAYLTQTEEKYKLSDDAAITLMIISASYGVGMSVASVYTLWWTTSPLNPAVALAMLTFATFDGNVDNMHMAWNFLVWSWGGAALAVLCYEFGFKKFQNTVEKQEDAVDELKAEDGANDIVQPMLE